MATGFTMWDYTTGKLWRVSANGEERMQIGDDSTYLFVVHEDRILYMSGDDLCSIRTDGSDQKNPFASENGGDTFSENGYFGWLDICTRFL